MVVGCCGRACMHMVQTARMGATLWRVCQPAFRTRDKLQCYRMILLHMSNLTAFATAKWPCLSVAVFAGEWRFSMNDFDCFSSCHCGAVCCCGVVCVFVCVVGETGAFPRTRADFSIQWSTTCVCVCVCVRVCVSDQFSLSLFFCSFFLFPWLGRNTMETIAIYRHNVCFSFFLSFFLSVFWSRAWHGEKPPEKEKKTVAAVKFSCACVCASFLACLLACLLA